MGLRPEATQGAPRSSRQSGVVAVLPIVTHTSTPPHIAPFFRAPPYGDISNRVPPYGATKTSSRKPLQAMRGSASPKGEARREAPARQSKANAAPGRITGGGGRAV